MAAGPVTSQPARRATRPLGSPRKQQEAPAIERKTAKDFIAEGVEDDTADFVEEDIRFGIDDVKDPFLEREKEEQLEKEIEEGETLRKSVGSTVDVTGCWWCHETRTSTRKRGRGTDGREGSSELSGIPCRSGRLGRGENV